MLVEYLTGRALTGIDFFAERVAEKMPEFAEGRIFVLTPDEFKVIHCAVDVLRDRALEAHDAAEELERGRVRGWADEGARSLGALRQRNRNACRVACSLPRSDPGFSF
jgi:hypothetical protein